MFSFIFTFPPETLKPGYVERIFVEGPFYKMTRHPQSGQLVPIKGPFGYVPDIQAAGRWVTSLAQNFRYPSTKARGFLHGIVLTPDGTQLMPDGEPRVLAAPETPLQPSTSAAHVIAGQPIGPPVGNRGAPVGLPPSVPTQRPQTLPTRDPLQAAGYENLDDSALPVTADGFLDADPQGGTFTDLDAQTAPVNPNAEQKRSLEPRPYDANDPRMAAYDPRRR